MANKQFAERLNKGLDSIDLPRHYQERTEALSKLLHVPRFKAQSYIEGISMPDDKVMSALCDELEVDVNWLLGKD